MKKFLLICSLLLCILSIYNINSVFEQKNSLFSISDLIPIAKANDGEQSGSWIPVTTTMAITNDYTTTLGCPEGEQRNCLVYKTTITITCLPGGNKACYSGTSSFDTTHCGDCFGI